ncbi:hypothetical protein ACHAWF_013333 [Thalassiosira exigua]
MATSNGPSLFHVCLLICALLSNAFAVPAPSYRARARRRLARRWHADDRGEIKFDPTRSGPSPLFAVERCGGADDKDLAGKASPASGVLSWYMTQLDERELPTKFLSSAVLSLVGDASAQKVAHFASAAGFGSMSFDKQRLMAMFFDGLLCTGPLLHYVYELYERIVPTHVVSGDGSGMERRFLASLAHVLFDNFVMVVVYIAVMMVTTALMEGRRSIILHELTHDLVPAVKVSWKVSIFGYIPFQLYSFQFLPIKMRVLLTQHTLPLRPIVLAVNVLDIVWVTVMSFVTHRNRH